MERKQVKKILLFYRDIQGEIRLCRRQLQNYEDIYCQNSGTSIDGMPHGKHKTSTPTETAALNIPEPVSIAMQNLHRKTELLAALETAVLFELNKLPLLQKRILTFYYIQGLQWVQISRRVHYSGTQCKKIRNHALDNLAKLFAENRLIQNFNYPV